MENKIFEAQDVCLNFGGLRAVRNFNLALAKNELVGLIGPNGAGKTTVFNIITGAYRAHQGSLFFQARRISGLKSYQISKLGISRTFQNIRLFLGLSVLDNVLVACHQHTNHSLADSILRTNKFLRDEKVVREKALALLAIFGLEELKDELAGNLPYGQQRRLEIVRALATDPKLLLLDEPAAGMNPQETSSLMQLIKRIREQFNLTILLIEHDMKVIMGICQRILVLDYGVTIAEGAPEQIKKDPKVIEAYLGEATQAT